MPVLELPTGGEDQREFFVWHFARRQEVHRHQSGAAAGAGKTVPENNVVAGLIRAWTGVGHGILPLQSLPADVIE